MGIDDHYPRAEGVDSYGVEAGNNTLLRQAPMTAKTYMECAVIDIDRVFGKGYAAKHPELVGAYMQTAAIDMAGGVIARALGTLATAVEGISMPGH
jgi:hypothetical protein